MAPEFAGIGPVARPSKNTVSWNAKPPSHEGGGGIVSGRVARSMRSFDCLFCLRRTLTPLACTILVRRQPTVSGKRELLEL